MDSVGVKLGVMSTASSAEPAGLGAPVAVLVGDDGCVGCALESFEEKGMTVGSGHTAN